MRTRTRRSALLAFGCSTLAVAGDSGAQPTPGPRYGHEMVFDEARNVTLLFGGFGADGVPKGDTWAWDGASWRLLATAGPSPRKWAAAAYDSRRNVVVLFGGREGVGRTGPSRADTWTWDGSEWRQSEATGPPGRDHHRAVYDRRRDRVLLFGGWDGERVIGDTWEWDGHRWHHASSEGPSPRAPFGMAYHEALGQTFLMGGQNLEETFADAWTWEGREWTRVDVDGPGPRGFHAMTYDAAEERILLYGGREGDRLLHDLWSWDGRRWEELPDGGPRRRGIYASAYDRPRRALVIHGGGDLVDGTWALESSTWTWTEASGWMAAAGSDAR